jgi:hypothetical protein
MLSLALLSAAPADAGKRAKKKPTGIAGVVLSATCYWPCIEPPPPEPVYTEQVTVTATRVSTGALVASATTDGRFRFRLKRGLYDVTAMVPGPPPCPPDAICPAASPTRGGPTVCIA